MLIATEEMQEAATTASSIAARDLRAQLSTLKSKKVYYPQFDLIIPFFLGFVKLDHAIRN